MNARKMWKAAAVSHERAITSPREFLSDGELVGTLGLLRTGDSDIGGLGNLGVRHLRGHLPLAPSRHAHVPYLPESAAAPFH